MMLLTTAQTAWAQDPINGLTYNTEGGYYEINDAQDLIDLATYVNAGNDASGKTFKQTADITFSHSTDWNNTSSSESNFSGIGTANIYFKGSYYGQEHTISGLRMSVWGQCVGLFRNVKNAIIDGIVLADSRITGYHNTGGIVGYTYRDGGNCIVSNCHVRSDVLIHFIGTADQCHGGIVGYNGSGCVVTNCTSAVTMTGDASCSYFGGIVGNNRGTISNSIALGVTIGDIDGAYGAIAGSNGNGYGVLSNNYYFDCTVQGRTSNIGCYDSDYTANDGAVNASPTHFTASGDIFTIKSAVGWSVFRGALYHNDRYNRFSGKTVKLDADIEVSTMAGTESHPFCGIFDGQGHILTFNHESTDSNTRTAPFSHVDGATIQGLTVGGAITGTAYSAAGFIGATGSTASRITNCVSSVVISAGQYTGGFSTGSKVRIEGCLFNGKINGSYQSGGFVGYSEPSTTITNCICDPQEGSSGGTFYFNNASANISNCYYTHALGTPQGKLMHSITAGTNITSLAISGTATAYSVSGITAYANKNGLQYDGTVYAGNGENVTLTISQNAVPAGYYSSYTVSAGTLEGTTLIMPDQDVTVSATYTPITYNITYYKNGGTLTTDHNTYTVESPTITLDQPTRTGYTFGGWYTNSGLTGTPVTTIAHGSTGHVNLWAKWTPITYAVHFNGNSNTGGAMDDQAFTYDQAQKLTANGFTRSYTVTFDYNGATGGNDEATATATATFNGWATTANGEVAYSDQQSVSNLTADDGGTVDLFAKWTKNSITLPTPIRTGYTFGSWYRDAKLSASIGAAGAAYTPSADITLYAKWNTITYDISYDLAGGTVATANPITYNVETETFTLTNPTKPGYTFIGWTGSNGDTPQTEVTIWKGSDGNRNYTANFKSSNIEWSYNSGTNTLTISGIGPMGNCENNRPWEDYCDDITTVIISSGVTSIGDYAFAWCNSLTEVTIPASVTTIGGTAFQGCTGLTSIEIPASVTTIGDYAFGNCSALTSIEIPASVTTIGGAAFQGCTGLTSIEIPASVTTIGESAFSGCERLNSITIPASVKSIGESAFSRCECLNSITIPASVTSIGESAFAYCTGLESISVADGNTKYDSRNDCNAIIETASKTLVSGCKNTVIPDGITGIGNYAFIFCTGLSSITIPASVTSIGSGAFFECLNLSSITIPASVTSIGSGAFSGCERLNSITIPASVTSIGESAFLSCTSLTTVIVQRGEPSITQLGEWAFDECNELTIYVPADKVNDYKNGWGGYAGKIKGINEISAIALADKADNRGLIAGVNGQTLDVTLQGRTLYKDGDWNTLCLPFDVTLSGSPLEGATVKELVSSSFEDGTLTMNFSDNLTAIEAGKSYIIKWASDDNLISPVFTGVTIDNTMRDVETECADFKGQYNKQEWTEENRSILFLGAENKLYFPQPKDGKNPSLGAFRAYFQLKGITAGDVASARMSFDEETTEIRTTDYTDGTDADSWYTLDGRKITGKPTTKGFYINGNKKVYVK